MPDDFVLPTELPPVDNSGLLDTAQRIRSTLNVNDPKSIYHMRPDLAAAAEARVQAAMLRANVSDRGPATAEQIAARDHEASWRFKTMPAGLVETINERSAAVVARGSVDEQAKALRDQLGPATYDRLVADAKNSRPDLGGAVGDAHALRLLASQGKYLAAYRGGKKS